MLNAIPTRFKLPVEQVDLLIDSGAEALRVNSGFRQFLTSLGGRVPFLQADAVPAQSAARCGANGAADAFAAALPEIPAAVSSDRN